MKTNNCQREFDFALVVTGVTELNDQVLDALFAAGCDDATFSIQYGQVYAEFSRTAESLQDAILSAIEDVRKADIGATVLRVDECDLVTPSDIARRIGRTRQAVSQYISGVRGPGNFPAPECHLGEGAPLWAWCAVSYWLAQNDIIKPEDGWNAEVVATINNVLEASVHEARHPGLSRDIAKRLNLTKCICS